MTINIDTINTNQYKDDEIDNDDDYVKVYQTLALSSAFLQLNFQDF